MATVKIGGKDHQIAELNFSALERAWPFIEEAMTATNVMIGVRAGLCIIAAGTMERVDFDPTAYGITDDKIDKLIDREEQVFDLLVHYFKKNLVATEIGLVRNAVNDIMQEAGLVPDEGEVQVEGTATSPSTETSVQSSQSSLPLDAREAAGTA